MLSAVAWTSVLTAAELPPIEAVLFEPDADALDNRLDAMARAVCDGDPRTLDQRRADALGAIGHRAEHLACLCGSADCPADGVQPNTVVINVIAEERTLTDDTPVRSGR